jgi:antitoxin MazE6
MKFTRGTCTQFLSSPRSSSPRVIHAAIPAAQLATELDAVPFGMKTAVSIPDDVFEKVERMARRSSRSRSEVFSAALQYVARHAPDEVTESMNKVCESVSGADDTLVAEAARRVLDNSEW